MPRRAAIAALLLATLAGLSLTVRARRAPASPADPAAPTDSARAPRASTKARVPVLVELYTSEGCSSCPPADAELARLEATQPVPSAEIVPLAYHVDYWDRLGWRDPFSSGWASTRQRSFAGLGGVYTPQAIVAGSRDVLGSRGAALEAAVADAARAPRAEVRLRVKPGRGPASREIEIVVSALPSDGDARVMLSLVQRRASVRALRGENAGRTLAHTAIARSLRDVGAVARGGATLTATIDLPAGLAPADARVVGFVERASPRAVVGVGASDLTP